MLKFFLLNFSGLYVGEIRMCAFCVNCCRLEHQELQLVRREGRLARDQVQEWRSQELEQSWWHRRPGSTRGVELTVVAGTGILIKERSQKI